jgi:hypothetical protein
MGFPMHRTEIDLSDAMQVAASQKMSQWCWAASVSMAFHLVSHPVSQDRIVRETYGRIDNFPALNGAIIAKNLNRQWCDDDGHPFTVNLTHVFDADAGVAALPNASIIDSLAHDTPLIVGTIHHAMLLTAIEWAETPIGPSVTSVGVFDPWPGIGFRGLRPAEFTPVQLHGQLRFVASFSLRDGGPPPVNHSTRLNLPTKFKKDLLNQVGTVLNDCTVAESTLRQAMEAFNQVIQDNRSPSD